MTMRSPGFTGIIALAAALLAGVALAEEDEPPPANAEEVARWRERIPLGPPGSDPVRVPADAASRDPHPGIVFEDATVFSGGQTYFWISPPLEDEAAGLDSTRWRFFPSGRFVVRFLRHEGESGALSRNEFWGRYRVTPEEELEIDADDGLADVLRLQCGRRYLHWEDTMFEVVLPEEKEGDGH